MSAATARSHTRHGWVFHLTAAAVAVTLLPRWHQVLHIGGDQYGGATALALGAWFLHRRTGWWVAWAAFLTAVLGGITDLPVVHDTVTYLTGAAW